MNSNSFKRKDKALSTLFVLVFMVVGIFFLKATAAVFAPIVFAVMISFMLFPVMQRMERHHIPRTLAVVIIMSVLAVVVYFLVVIAQNSFTEKGERGERGVVRGGRRVVHREGRRDRAAQDGEERHSLHAAHAG